MAQKLNAVLITGASSGIGRAVTIALARKNWRVFACVRSTNDQVALQNLSPHITALILDVTKSDEIQKAFEFLSTQQFASFNLINNAGISVAGPVEVLPVVKFKEQFDVNFFGLIEVTQKFLPLIKKTKGRILNISSVSGLNSSPFLGAYSASKYALETISDSLRWELASCGVKVVLIEPGPIATDIWKKGMRANDGFQDLLTSEQKGYYLKPIGKFTTYVKFLEKNALSVDAVTKAY
jgi:NAD(P)-dependent dehydrogenase (short-subunit alcohol dehydrogenase family)